MSVYIGVWRNSANDTIELYWSAASEITLLYNMDGGGNVSDTWDCTGVIDAATKYKFAITYTGSGDMVFSVDGVAKITLSSIPAAFGSAPDASYWGSDASGDYQSDAVFEPLLSVDTTAALAEATAAALVPTIEAVIATTGRRHHRLNLRLRLGSF